MKETEQSPRMIAKAEAMTQPARTKALRKAFPDKDDLAYVLSRHRDVQTYGIVRSDPANPKRDLTFE